MPSDLTLFVDFAGNQLLTGVNTNPAGRIPRFVLGDSATVDLHLVEFTGSTDFPAVEISTDNLAGASSATVLALGSLETLPTSGNFSLTFGANSTPLLAFNATAAQVSTGLNALASVVSSGGVSVAQVGESYRIAFNGFGVRSAITATTAALCPKASALVVESTVGSVSTPSVQVVRLRVNPVAVVNTWTALPSASATLSIVRPWDGINSTVRLILADAVGGSFGLGFTVAGTLVVYSAPLLAYNFNALDLTNAFQSWAEFSKPGAVSVRQVGTSVFDITTTVPPDGGSPVDGWTVDGSGLDSSVGLRGVISLATVEAETTLDGGESVGLTLEVQVSAAGGAARTVLQTNATLVEDLIEGAICVPIVGDVCLGAVEAAGIYATLADVPNADEFAAIQAGDVPTALNPFITLSALASGGYTIPANVRLALMGGASPSAANPFLTESAGEGLFLDQSLNLSDLPSPATARTNLGLGTAATASASAFAQIANNLSDLVSVSTARTNLGLGTIATAPATDYLAKADNLAGLASTVTSRTNLGLGTMATETATDYLAKADNLAGLANPATARANLGIVPTAGILTDSSVFRLEDSTFWDIHHTGPGTAATALTGVRQLVGGNPLSVSHSIAYTTHDPIWSNGLGSFNFTNNLRISGKCHNPTGPGNHFIIGVTYRILVGLKYSQRLNSGSTIPGENLIGFSWRDTTTSPYSEINIITGDIYNPNLTESPSPSYLTSPTLFDNGLKSSFAWELILDHTAGTLSLVIDGVSVHSVTAPVGYSGSFIVSPDSAFVIREEIETDGTHSLQPLMNFSTRVITCS